MSIIHKIAKLFMRYDKQDLVMKNENIYMIKKLKRIYVLCDGFHSGSIPEHDNIFSHQNLTPQPMVMTIKYNSQ